jgi:predicted Ser/Thr protein kinase
MLKLLPLIQKYKLDFLPKIVDYNEDGYTYEWVDGQTLKE